MIERYNYPKNDILMVLTLVIDDEDLPQNQKKCIYYLMNVPSNFDNALTKYILYILYNALLLIFAIVRNINNIIMINLTLICVLNNGNLGLFNVRYIPIDCALDSTRENGLFIIVSHNEPMQTLLLLKSFQQTNNYY